MIKINILIKLKEKMEKTNKEYTNKSFSKEIDCEEKEVEELLKEYKAEDLEDLYFKTRSEARLEQIKKHNKILKKYFESLK
jgi:hypothetical protein